MIVRIMGEGQFEVEGDDLDALRHVDEALLEAVREGDGAAFSRHLGEAVAIVRRGRSLPIEALRESDLVLPAPDMTVQDARKLFDEHQIL
jgi:CBS-domain-containing membrane protein